jgi:hypothetical protein
MGVYSSNDKTMAQTTNRLFHDPATSPAATYVSFTAKDKLLLLI